MKNIQSLNTKSIEQFTISINQVNDQRALLPHVLYKKIEGYTLKSVVPFHKVITSKPSLQRLNILKNAFLNDELIVKGVVKKLSAKELLIAVEVTKNIQDSNDVICNAVFGFELKEKYFEKAS
jgi:hypothetical protein